MTLEEVSRLLATTKATLPRYYPLLLCAVRTGLRMGELLALQWGDIDWQQCLIDVRRNYTHQNGESPVYVKDQMGHSSIQVTVDLYGHLIPGGNKQAVDRLDLPVDQPRLWLNFATPAHPVLDAAQASEREGLGDQGVTRRRYGVSDGFRTSPRCCHVVTRQDTMEHTTQRRIITSQRLGGLVGAGSIARPGVPLCAVSPRVLPEAVTQAVTPTGPTGTKKHSCLVRQKRGGDFPAGRGPLLGPLVGTATPTPRCNKTNDDAKRQALGQDAITYAHDIKLEALRLLGMMLKATERATGAKGIGTSAVPKGNHTPPTLADLHIDKKTSMLAQRHRMRGGLFGRRGACLGTPTPGRAHFV